MITVAGVEHFIVCLLQPNMHRSFLCFVVQTLLCALQDIQSGNCFAHNTLLFDNIQKGVLYGPWRMPITPFWSSHHKNAVSMIQAVTNFVAKPNMADLNKAAVAALWG